VRRLSSILFWSVISAAFIGPGTVTTAASAGSRFGGSLLWALVFSTLACLVLQEAAARLTVVSGLDLGQALRASDARAARGVAVLVLVLGAIVLGCAAYEAGNILGGAAGGALATGLDPRGFALAIAGAAAVLLWVGRTGTVVRLLGACVAIMGVAFLVTAWRLGPDPADLLLGSFVPTLPDGSDVLILGLVGTTVVPYNLFLGSGLARGQELAELRFGLAVAIVLGGLVSMGIVVVGTAVDGTFGFAALASVLDDRLGGGSGVLFAVGLCAAGVSSAITAPLAAAVTARSLFAPASHEAGPDAAATRTAWSERGRRFRAVWLAVLAVGVVFGLADVKPVPAIILAQALNGLLLPLVACFLLLCVNDRKLMGREALNGAWANAVLVVVVLVAVVLGLGNLTRAVASAAGIDAPGGGRLLLWTTGLAVAAAIPLVRRLLRLRRGAARH